MTNSLVNVIKGITIKTKTSMGVSQYDGMFIRAPNYEKRSRVHREVESMGLFARDGTYRGKPVIYIAKNKNEFNYQKR